jgi:hypothetical protein
MADPPSDMPKMSEDISETPLERTNYVSDTDSGWESESEFSCGYEDLDPGECISPSGERPFREDPGVRRNGGRASLREDGQARAAISWLLREGR